MRRDRAALRLMLALPFLAVSVQAAGASAVRDCYPQDEASEKDIGYCQAVRVGNTLHVSGVVGQGPMDAAMRSVYDELKRILAAQGMGFADVVKETVFATDLDAFIRHKNVRKTYYGSALPAASWVQVQRLYAPAYVVEVELTAEFPAK